MTGQPIFPRLFRPVRFAGLVAGLLLSFLAIYDWLNTVRLAVRRPLADTVLGVVDEPMRPQRIGLWMKTDVKRDRR